MVMGDETEGHPKKIEANTSPLISDQNPEATSIVENAANNYALRNLGRQSSIYSLTLDEFQHTLFESGKNFKSMNMDEFLNSIWTAEESQAHNPGENGVTNNNSNAGGDNARLITSGASSGWTIAKQPSLSRQGSLSLPPPLCGKTVDEVWSQIQKSRHHQQQQQQQQQPPSNPAAGVSSAQEREATFGEMTLEDFLVKAGVVREHCPTPNIPSQQPPPPQQQHQYVLYQNANNPQAGLADNRTFMGIGAGTMPAYPGMPPNIGIIGEPSGKGNKGYPAMPLTNIPYGGTVVNGSTATAGGYGPGLALGSPVSPLSSDGVCGASQVDNSVNPYGFDMGDMRGRKRPMDGPGEKVVERRQRRMIKNRESAARSRARKQAYTVELEAELNQLREENAQLKQAVAELEMQRKQQQYLEEQQKMARTRAQKAKDKLSMMRRARSCPL